MIGWMIIACEIGFWFFFVAGLFSRYVLKKNRLGMIFLICTPIIDVLLLIATFIDLKNEAVATTVHGIAAIYIGVSVAYGHQMVRWADRQFFYRFAQVDKPFKLKKYGTEKARAEREGWYRHVLAWVIGASLMGGIVLYIHDTEQTNSFLETMRAWSIVLVIDFFISFSYTVFPRKETT
ncbi:hypothetical protein [Halobacillus mangrovi]|uniref:hypothetical protein n=1 Tax=Halobacillus mangrovi TaxID=402384 RepID=UPI003D954BBB